MIVCGMDECGRGALAGPLVAVGVATNSKFESLNYNLGLKDSKKLTEAQRNIIYKKLLKSRVVIMTEEISVREINIRGMAWANKEIFKRLARKVPADSYVADGNLKLGRKIKSIVKADTRIPEVMAASIIAKVFRDRIMVVLHRQFPLYGWKSNKGYGTSYHVAALHGQGVSKYHRRVFVATALL